MIHPYLELSILYRAIERGLLEVDVHDIRDWTIDKHSVTDDTPYGGGGGMVMKPDPIFAAVEDVLGTIAGLSGDSDDSLRGALLPRRWRLSFPIWTYCPAVRAV